MRKIIVGHEYRFDYPDEFVTLPKYSAHRGQVITVVRLCDPVKDQVDPECMPMYIIRAGDGWTGHANPSELGEI